MKSIPDVISRSAIFDSGDIFVFSENENRRQNADPLDVLCTIRSESDILLWLDFNINYLAKQDLLEITDCQKVTDGTFKLLLKIRESGEEIQEIVYLHRLMTVQDRVNDEWNEYVQP
jgi:hypothetical protein